MKHFESPSFQFRAKNGSPRSGIATHSSEKLCYFVPSQIKSEILKLTIQKAKAILPMSLFLLAGKEKAICYYVISVGQFRRWGVT